MSDNTITVPKAADEKTGPIMVYTAAALYWGESVVKQQIRMSTWLRTQAAPDFVPVYNVKFIVPASAGTPRPMFLPEIHIPIKNVLALHLQPPAQDPIDYDPNEPNRRMDPVSIIAGTFRIDGLMRMATISTMQKYLEVTRESYTTIYEAQISNMVMPSLGIMRVPLVIVRQMDVTFAIRSIAS
ncbi:MAG TPA: hypothetical protein VN376_08660 [Longilinea sp.]|nr:hypothetical protein [Longilinea sp.]